MKDNKKFLFVNNKKAFTLIELLAIIVILAIIAVITVPIILNIIDNSKRGAAINSALGYRDAIQKFYMYKMMSDSTYVIENGEYDIHYYVNEGLSVNGEIPADGWILIEDKNITDFSIKIGDYVVTYISSTDTVIAEKGGNVSSTPTQKKAQEYLTSLKVAIGNVSDIFNLPVDEVLSTDVTSGWVALNNGEVIGYSLQVGDKTTLLSTKDESIDSIVETFAITYLNGLTIPDSEIVVDVEESGKLKGGFIEYKLINSIISINNYSLEYEIDGVTKYANYVSKQLTVQDVKKEKPIAGVVNTGDGAKYYTGTHVIYYNPGSSSVGTGPCTVSDYNDNIDKNGTTGCLKWYRYSLKENADITYENLILDHNINAGCSGDECKWASLYNSEGPVLALSALKTYTSSWQTETPKVPNKYGANGTESNPHIVPETANDNKYSIDYDSYKARLITKEEVDRIKASNSNSIPSDLYGNQDGTSGNCGYWTSSPYSGLYSVRFVNRRGFLDYSTANYTCAGIRPVISVTVLNS